MSGENERKIEKFLDDENLIELRKSIKESEEKFNPFKILKINNFEIRHSRMLAWLLDPKGHHGLGNKVLKGILEVLGEESKFKCALVEGDDEEKCSDLEVVCEKEKIDILAYCKTHNLVVAIENKIYAGEDVGDGDKKGQLDGYVGKVNEEFPEDKWTQVFIYLSIDGIPPKGGGDKYVSLTHKQIYDIVLQLVEDDKKLFEDSERKKVFDFIDFYLEILREKTELREKLDRLHVQLYVRHHEAVEDIIKMKKEVKDKSGEVITSNLINAIAKTQRQLDRKLPAKIIPLLQEKDSDIERLGQSRREFIHKSWKTRTEEKVKGDNKYPFAFYFATKEYFKSHKVSINLYRSTFEKDDTGENEEKREWYRKQLKKELEENGANIEGNLTRVDIKIKTIHLKDTNGVNIDLSDYDAVAERIVTELELEKEGGLIGKVIDTVAKVTGCLAP